MGRDWYKLAGGGGGDRRGGGRTSDSFSTRRKTEATERNVVSGCMASLFHLFDFHHFYLSAQHHHQQPSSPSSKPTTDFLQKDQKGLAAPRNSLDLTGKSSSSTTHKEQECLSFPMGIQVETKARVTRSKLGALSIDTSEIVSSPGAKTPTLVARLMGLDLLPDDNTDHNHSSLKLHRMSSHRPRHVITSHRPSLDGKIAGTMSLPESPRVSSARRADFDLHRLSLQQNRENEYGNVGYSRMKELGQENEIRNPQNYARRRVNQIKERVSIRRFGMDITNTVKNREPESARNNHELRRDTLFSCSPRNRFPENENRANANPKKTFPSTSKPDQISQQVKPPSSPLTMPTTVSEPKASKGKKKPKTEKQRLLRPINRCKEESEARFSLMHQQRPKTRNKQEEIFVRASTSSKANNNNAIGKKSKKASFPLPNDVIHIPEESVFPVKKIPSPRATKLPQKQANETQGATWNPKQSLCSRRTYEHEENLPQIARCPGVEGATTVSSTSPTAETTSFSSEYEYIVRILNYAGISETNSPVSSTTRFSPSYPLGQSISHDLEHFRENPFGKLAVRCNRKLLFDLVNEILGNILNPRWETDRHHHGSGLIGEVSSFIGRYPRVNFRGVEDIGSLVAGNLPETTKFQEEGEEIVAEIERQIVDAVVRETASYLYQTETASDRI